MNIAAYRPGISVLASLLTCILGVGVLSLQAQTPDGPRLAVQVDSLLFFRGDSEFFSPVAFSPFLAIEWGLFSRLSLRVGLSPPLGQDPGQQAFATNLALNVWLGKRPDYFETGLASYYQNTWCNGSPDYRAYTIYLGWRHVSKKVVFRFGGSVGVTSEGDFVAGIGIGFGRSVGPGTS